MNIITDLHLHSRYARACSKDLSIKTLSEYAKIKGINLLGTGDAQHPKWQEELKKELTDNGQGIFETKYKTNFALTTEISFAYSQAGKGRRIHLITWLPNFEVLTQFTEFLLKKGRIDYDGRPIFGMNCIEFVEECMKISKDIEIIPAHAWTPWFGIFGSKTGFDSLKDCFQEQTKNIHAIETGISCYDQTTEVLTSGGWKKFFELTYTDKICTLNAKNNNVEFQNPLKIFEYNYEGKMYELKTKRVDLFVTPNHKLFVTTCDFRNPKPFFLKEAELMFGKSKQFKKDGNWIGNDLKYFVLPAVKIKHGSGYYRGLREKKETKIIMTDWLKFFGFWIAEGWTTLGNNGDYGVYVCNKKPELISEMKQLLISFGYNPLYIKRNFSLRVRDYQLFCYLKQFGKCYDKSIPSDIKELSKDNLKILLDYYLKGDGHIYGRTGKGLSATTTSIKLRDDLQEIALKIGISAYYKLHQKKGTLFKSQDQKKQYKQRNDSWNIYFIRHNQHAVIPSTLKKYSYIEKLTDFKGKVYCASVPNKIIYVRRNGIPVWCGNSDPAMNWRLPELDDKAIVSFSDAHSYWPWRLGREATIFDMKDLSYKELITAVRENKIVETIEFFPEEGKYHYDGHKACGIVMDPNEALKNNNICPVCKKTLTIGVAHRIEELAKRPLGEKPKNARPYRNLIPIAEVISGAIGSPVASKKVAAVYNKLIEKFGNEFNILLNASDEEIQKNTDQKVAEYIIKNRHQKIKFLPGYDGEYGHPIFDENEEKETITRTRCSELS